VQNMKKIATVLHRLGRHLFSTTNTLIQKLIHATKPAKMRALSVIRGRPRGGLLHPA
jgi:hypothetical protein